ncbi:MAG: hypothetical protein GY716_18380 [bacterium]|nr:hypothetical protein [bacterium]
MSQKRGCFKTGCLGCGGVAALMLVVSISLFAFGVMMGKPEENRQQRELTRAVPSVALPDTGDASSDVGLSLRIPGDFEVPPESMGRVDLDLSIGEFEILPGKPGEPLRVEAEFDSGSFELEESFSTEKDGSWVYRVSFGRSISIFRFIRMEDETMNRVRIYLPPDVPIALTGELGLGEFNIELGGLWVTETSLELGAGEHEIRVSEPTVVPMRTFKLRASVGELGVVKLGNASPAKVDVRQRIGETSVDLRGAWRTDGDVYQKCGIGECSVRVPEGVHLDFDRARVGLGEAHAHGLGDLPPPPPGAPTVKLVVKGSLGEVRVSR